MRLLHDAGFIFHIFGRTIALPNIMNKFVAIASFGGDETKGFPADGKTGTTI
jgi:hypothetical protein